MAKHAKVRLRGIPLREQGDHDSLCAYYAAAMLLCALEPAFEDGFDAPRVKNDPLFGNLPLRRGERLDAAVAIWLTSGVSLSRLCSALNRAMRARGASSTRFRHEIGARTLRRLCADVDAGLPPLLAWDSTEMGDHTVLVIGYDRYRSGRVWLRVLDPIRSCETQELDQVRRLADRIEVIHAVSHKGPRPDKLTAKRGGKSVVERWDPSTERYVKILR